MSEDVAGKERWDDRTPGSCIEDQDQDADIWKHGGEERK